MTLKFNKLLLSVLVVSLWLTACSTSSQSDKAINYAPMPNGKLTINVTPDTISASGNTTVTLSGNLVGSRGGNGTYDPLPGEKILVQANLNDFASGTYPFRDVGTTTTDTNGNYSLSTTISEPTKFFAKWMLGSTSYAGTDTIQAWQQVEITDINPVNPIVALNKDDPYISNALNATVIPETISEDVLQSSKSHVEELIQGNWQACCNGTSLEISSAGIHTYRINFSGDDQYRPVVSSAVDVFAVLTDGPSTSFSEDPTDIDQMFKNLSAGYCDELGTLITRFGSIGGPELALLDHLAGDAGATACNNNPDEALNLWRNFGNYLSDYLKDKQTDLLDQALLDKTLSNVLDPIVEHMNSTLTATIEQISNHMRSWLIEDVYQVVQAVCQWVTSETLDAAEGAVSTVADHIHSLEP